MALRWRWITKSSHAGHERLAAFIARLAEGRKSSGIAVADAPDGLRRAAKQLNRIISEESTKPANGVSICAFKLCGMKPVEALTTQCCSTSAPGARR